MKIEKDYYSISKETIEKVLAAIHENFFSLTDNGDEQNNDEVIEAYRKLQAEILQRNEEVETGNIYKEIQEYWNEKVPECKIMRLGSGRKRKLATRLKEADFRDNWKEIVDQVHDSNFLRNEWVNFNFDWVVENDDNYVKIFEGKYRNKPKPSAPEWMVEKLKKLEENEGLDPYRFPHKKDYIDCICDHWIASSNRTTVIAAAKAYCPHFSGEFK